jgi:hypothetical protein
MLLLNRPQLLSATLKLTHQRGEFVKNGSLVSEARRYAPYTHSSAASHPRALCRRGFLNGSYKSPNRVSELPAVAALF